MPIRRQSRERRPAGRGSRAASRRSPATPCARRPRRETPCPRPSGGPGSASSGRRARAPRAARGARRTGARAGSRGLRAGGRRRSGSPACRERGGGSRSRSARPGGARALDRDAVPSSPSTAITPSIATGSPPSSSAIANSSGNRGRRSSPPAPWSSRWPVSQSAIARSPAPGDLVTPLVVVGRQSLALARRASARSARAAARPATGGSMRWIIQSSPRVRKSA